MCICVRSSGYEYNMGKRIRKVKQQDLMVIYARNTDAQRESHVLSGREYGALKNQIRPFSSITTVKLVIAMVLLV